MANNFSQVCLNYSQMLVHGSKAEMVMQRYVYPVIVVFGIAGNLLNLTVLLNRSMRNRSNSFLAALAFADIIFLILVVPHILANYPAFITSYNFRYFYFHTRVHLLTFANWTSCIAIWCVIVVCVERLIGIRRPLSVKAEWEWYKVPLILAIIVFATGAITLYKHFEFLCITRDFCHGTQIYSQCRPVNSHKWFSNQTNPTPLELRTFVDISVKINAVTMVFIPIILLTLFNALLLCTLRHRSNTLLTSEDSRCSTDQTSRQRTEQRVTLTVALIVTTFTVTNGPSAINYLIVPSELHYPMLICNSLVIVGKALNFILFCLSSKHFRRRLMQLAQRSVSKQFGKLSSSMLVDSSIGNTATRIRSRSLKRNSVVNLLNT